MTEFEIRDYRPGDEAGILESFNLVFREVCGPGYVDRAPQFWDWEFRDGPGGHRIVVAAADDGVIAAQYAGVAQVFDTDHGETRFVHIVDSFVRPEFRAGLKKPGLFVTTALPWFELCDRMGDAVLYGYPVRTAERIGTRYLDYKFLRTVLYLCRDAAAGSSDGPRSVTVDRLESVPEAADDLYRRCGRSCQQRRDRRYLDWRYRRVPGGAKDYEIHAARRDGALAGLMVLRPTHELIPGSCTIADWLVAPDDADVRAALLAMATTRARQLGRRQLLAVFADSSPEFAAFGASGFRAVPSADFLERRLTHRIYHPRMTSEWLADHWWYTLGDSDLV